MILLLYVDDLFVTSMDGLIADEILGYDALFFRHGGVVECRWNLPWTREVCNRYFEEIQDDGL